MNARFAAQGALSRRSFSIALALALVAVAAVPVRADDAAALLAKHKAYAGWSFGDGTFKTLVSEWTITRTKDNTVLYTDTEYQSGVKDRSDYSSARDGSEWHHGFTGAFLWQSSQNGFTTKLIGDPAKSVVSEDLVFDEAAGLGTAVLQPSQTIDGKSYGVVRAKLDASLPVDLYIDPATGAYRRAVIDPGGAFELVFDILATTEPIPGKKVISRFSVGRITYTLGKVTPNEPIADASLAPPQATAKWKFGSGDAIPIKLTNERIFLTAKINGVEGHFILDTGAYGIVLNNDFARRAQLETGETTTGTGIGGSVKLTQRRARTFTIGDNTLSNVVVASTKIDGLGDEGRDGVIGYDLFGAAIVVLNLDDSNLTVLDPGAIQPDTSAGVPVLVDLSRQVPVVTMKLNGKVDVRATLDSGSPLHVLFDRELIARNGLSFLIDRSSLASEMLAGGAGDEYVDVECGKLQSLALGPISYNAPPACMGQATQGTASDRDVLVGLDFLKHFNIVFDYPAGMMLFQLRKNEPK